MHQTTRTSVRRLGHIPSSRCQENRRFEPAEHGLFDVGRLSERSRSGGARRDRTDDLLLAKQALSQLSYGPVSTFTATLQAKDPVTDPATLGLVGLERFELSTSRLSSARSNQLSYRPGKRGGRPNEERETKAAVSRKQGFGKPHVVSKRRERAKSDRQTSDL